MPYIAGHPGESTTCSEQSMWYGDSSEKSALGDQLNENFIANNKLRTNLKSKKIILQLERMKAYKTQL